MSTQHIIEQMQKDIKSIIETVRELKNEVTIELTELYDRYAKLEKLIGETTVTTAEAISDIYEKINPVIEE